MSTLAKNAGRSRLRGAASVPTLPSGRYSQSLERGLAILGCFTSDTQLLGIVDIAKMLGMSRPTTHRYAITLVALGFLEQPANSGQRYRLGTKAHGLGLTVLNSRPLRAIARPHLQALRTLLSYTVSVGVLDGELLVMDRLPGYRGHAKLKLNVGVGSRLPTYCTSMGKTLLAHMSDDELDDAVGGVVLERWGPNTIRTKRALRTELEQIVAAGFAVEDEELTKGARAIAVPVRSNTKKVVAALEIAAPAVMLDRSRMVKQFGPKLLATSKRIARELNDEPPFTTMVFPRFGRVRIA